MFEPLKLFYPRHHSVAVLYCYYYNNYVLRPKAVAYSRHLILMYLYHIKKVSDY